MKKTVLPYPVPVAWLDQLEVGAKVHIQTIQQKRDELVAWVLLVALADLEAV